MATQTHARYWKMNGAGNDIVVLDMRAFTDSINETAAGKIAGHGITRCDQLMVLRPARRPETDGSIDIFNTDGSRAGACGNGMRCVTLVLSELTGERSFNLETAAGVLACQMESADRITVDMGAPKFRWDQIPLREAVPDTRAVKISVDPRALDVEHDQLRELQSASVASMGNPHAVFWVGNLSAYNLARIGPILEHHPMFPERANITLAQVLGPSEMRMATWERGAGLTKACGSAACAAAVSAARTGRSERRLTVHVPGGKVEIEWHDDDYVMMTGPAEHEHDGTVTIEPTGAGA